jgi:NAD(P)-dependent dehydrogenase (short-subunit alcohol dehydrogenase family)
VSALEGKLALVTGGSRGLGREIVRAFAHAGADVVIVSRKLEACEELAREVTGTTGRRAVPLAGHVGDWDSLEPLVDTVWRDVGPVDVLVNNAGISPLYDGLTDVTEALFDKVVDVNLKGPFRLTALMGARMAAGSGGSIVNISSTASLRPAPGELPYAAAKAGLNVLTSGFAQALGPAVRVNAIVAGPFLTDISKAWDMPAFEAAAAQYPLRRGGRPEEIAGAALYLASDASSFATGTTLVLDGGQTLVRG